MIDSVNKIKKFLVNDIAMKTLLDNKEAIYLIDKPAKETPNPYIVYLYKPIGTGNGCMMDAQIEFRIVGKDLSKLNALHSRLIKLLNFTSESLPIEGIRHSSLLNGGGMIFNESTGNYEIIIFFLLKL